MKIDQMSNDTISSIRSLTINGLTLGSKLSRMLGFEVNSFIEGSGVVVSAVGASVVIVIVVLGAVDSSLDI